MLLKHKSNLSKNENKLYLFCTIIFLKMSNNRYLLFRLRKGDSFRMLEEKNPFQHP